MTGPTLHPTRCAICKTDGNAAELYPPNFDATAFSSEVFSARRLPDRIHYRMVKCKTCGLVRSDPVADPQTLAHLYEHSSFNYGEEVTGLKRTYGSYLCGLERYGVNKDALLEIGCGNGFFLEEALARGYRRVQGVEPSREAMAGASPLVRDCIVCDMMRAGLFEAKRFDVICMFQVFDHISDPTALLDECFQVLRPGGVILILNHNIAALSARLLGERSPIVDIEHTYLYSPATLARLVGDHGFHVRRAGTVINNYTLGYLARLIPVPAAVKRAALAILEKSWLGRLPLWVPLGNLYLVAQKPGDYE